MGPTTKLTGIERFTVELAAKHPIGLGLAMFPSDEVVRDLATRGLLRIVEPRRAWTVATVYPIAGAR